MLRGASRRSSSIHRPPVGRAAEASAASGLCHSDEHLVTGDLPFALPIIGGHEGAGVVQEVGEGVSWLAPGDHVVFGFIPVGGEHGVHRARRLPQPVRPRRRDGPRHADLRRHGSASRPGQGPRADAPARHVDHTVVNEASCIKIENDVPLERACLLGCGVVTGWGLAATQLRSRPATSWRSSASAVSAPTPSKARWPGPSRSGRSIRWSSSKKAMEFGDAHRTVDDRRPPADHPSPAGTMANKVIMTMGVGSGAVLAEALALTAKRGRVVVTNIHPAAELSASVSLLDLTLMEKQVVGVAVRLGQPARLTSPSCSTCTAISASSSSTVSSPTPTRSTG